jgi:hypothetical protein
MGNPRAGVSWMRRPHVEQMLRTLARPETPITHETLSNMTPWRSVAYLRDLLMKQGVLPLVDRELVFFERWLAERLGELAVRPAVSVCRRSAPPILGLAHVRSERSLLVLAVFVFCGSR